MEGNRVNWLTTFLGYKNYLGWRCHQEYLRQQANAIFEKIAADAEL